MKIKLTVEYNGGSFAGWQVQPGERTVQGELESALERYLNSLCRKHSLPCIGAPRISASGRTDAGVHAWAQAVSFAWPLPVPCDLVRLRGALNGLIPRDIRVREAAEKPDDFDARFTAHRKRYRYEMRLEHARGGLWDGRAWVVEPDLAVERMAAAARLLRGVHDFSSFRAADCCAVNAVRCLEISEISRPAPQQLIYIAQGPGFLKQMIRIIVGTLVEVGRRRIEPDHISRLLEQRDRRLAGQTAPSCGLYLEWVRYNGD